MKYFIPVFVILAYSLFSQVVTVKDEKTQKPVPNVTVYSSDPNKALTTDSYGKVNIKSFKDAPQILFRLLGYSKKVMTYEQIIKGNNEVYLTENPISLGNIVVSSNRWTSDESEVMRTIELISPRDIELQNPQTAADMLNLSGNIYVQKSQLGGGSPMIRGFSTNRVLIVVDNVRMNNAIFRSGNLQNVISIDGNSLSNAEVIFGPGSVIYGSDAIGGVMDFTTLPAKYSYSDKVLFNGSALARYSSANKERTGNVNFNIGLNNIAFLTSVTFSKFDDLTQGSNGPDDYLRTFYQDRINGKDTMIINSDSKVQKLSGYDQLNVLQKIRFRPDEDWEMNYGFYYSATSDVPRYDRLIELKNKLPRDGQWYYGPQKWMMNSLSLTNSSGNGYCDIVKLILAYQNFEESRHNRTFNKKDLNHRTEKVDAFSGNLDFIKSISLNSELYYGLEAILNKVHSTGENENISTNVISPISTRYPNGSVWNSYGAYLSYKNKFAKDFIAEASLRYNLVYLNSDFDTTFFKFSFDNANLTTSAVTGSIGFNWFRNESQHFYINLSTGFRAPNVDDVGKVFDSTPGMVVVPNPDLKSEYIYSAEIGLRKAFAPKLKYDIALYYSYLDEAIVRRDFRLNGQDSIMYDGTISKVQAMQNAAFAYVYGIHAGFDFHFIKGFHLISKFNYQRGEEEDDAGNKVPLRHSSPWFGNTEFLYESDKITASFYAIYNGEIKYDDLAPTEREKVAIYAKDENGKPYSPSWYTLNFKMTYEFLSGLQVGAGIENLTDQRYRPYSSGISAPGRNFIGSLRYKL